MDGTISLNGATPTALAERVQGLLTQRNDQQLRSVLVKEEPHDIAEVIDDLERGHRKVFALLPPELQADVAVILSPHSRDIVLPQLSDFMIARFLHFCDEDRATDILQVLPAPRRTSILHKMRPEKTRRIEKLLSFGAETAGGLMDLDFVEVTSADAVPHILETVQDYARHYTQVPVVLVQTPTDIRWIPARVLVSAAPQASAGRLSQPVTTVLHSADREQVLDQMSKEDSDIVRVADGAGQTLGIIHQSDLLRIAEAEASEDAYRMGAVGLIESSYLESRFVTIWRKRVGWLSVLFLAELFTFTALSHFESSIATVTALALFVPLCISTGGNSGSQAATLITRAMALGDIGVHDWWRVLRRELLMGIALGLALGAVAFVRASLTPQSVLGTTDRFTLGFVIAQSVAAICLWGTLVGSMLPLVFRRLGFDPAYASSPFVATFVDVTGITIYFTIANVFILR